MPKKAIVIGSGVAGLAASIRLAQKGIETHVFEANDFPGGKINSRLVNGYRFDQGPSLLTCPEYIEELYTLCGKDFKSFEMSDLKSSFKYFSMMVWCWISSVTMNRLSTRSPKNLVKIEKPLRTISRKQRRIMG